MDDGAEIAAPESVLRYVALKYDNIEFAKAHGALPG
jgi:hypothetical protein